MIKVRFNQAKLMSLVDCAVPIKVKGVQIGVIGVRHLGCGVAGFFVEAPTTATGFGDTLEDRLAVSDNMVLSFAKRYAKAFGVSEKIELEHEMTAEQKAWLSIDIEHEEAR